MNTRFSQVPYLAHCDRHKSKTLLLSQEHNGAVSSVTGETLRVHVGAVSAALQEVLRPQQRVLLVLPQALAFAYSFLACLDANVVAIPIVAAEPPDIGLSFAKTDPLIQDCQPSAVITTSAIASDPVAQRIFDRVPLLEIEEVLTAEETDVEGRPHSDQDVALLLYTSGSTSRPKGIVLSHDSLLRQSVHGAAQWRFHETARIVSWAPLAHNVGLRFNVLAPLLVGASSAMLPATSFAKSPRSWFEAIHTYRATHTCAPNFAFDVCVSQIDPTEVDHAALATLEAAFNGGEPIQHDTCDRFESRFACIGLRQNVLCTHYGLSEVGSVSAGELNQPRHVMSLDRVSLTRGVVAAPEPGTLETVIISSGRVGDGLDVRIVDPVAGQLCAPAHIGEVWIKSAAVGSGYINHDDATKAAFSCALGFDGDYLRSGDLGFVVNDELYIVGRIKETIIVRGKNHWPSDIESTMQQALPTVASAVAVFQCHVDGADRVVALIEAEALSDEGSYANIGKTVVAAVSEQHRLAIEEVSFIQRGALLRSSSGKLLRQQSACAYTEGTLPVMYSHRTHDVARFATPPLRASIDSNSTASGLADVISIALQTDAASITWDCVLSELGIDSLTAEQIAARIAEKYQIACDPVILFRYSRFDELVSHVTGVIREAKHD